MSEHRPDRSTRLGGLAAAKSLAVAAASLALLGISAPLLSQGSPRLILQPVAELGDPAPGTGLLFEQFGAHHFFGRLLGIPNIARDGDLSFHAFLGDDGVPNSILMPLR